MLPYYQFTEVALGPIHIQVWGLFVALGIGLALILGVREAKKRNLDAEVFLSLGTWMILASIVGSRFMYVVLFWEEFRGNLWDILAFWNGGMVAFGGIFAAVLAGYVYLRVNKLSPLSYFDVVALVFPAGYALGRVGCHFIRDHMGSVTTAPWAFEVSEGISRHDTAVYSILAGICIFVIVWFFRKRLVKPGAAIIFVSALYATTRFVIDIFRARDLPFSDPRWFNLTVSQYISLLVVAVIAIILVRQKLSKSPKKSVDL